MTDTQRCEGAKKLTKPNKSLENVRSAMVGVMKAGVPDDKVPSWCLSTRINNAKQAGINGGDKEQLW